MLGLNEVRFIGNLVRDPEVRKTKNDTPVANFRIAVNQPNEEALFVDVTAWGALANTCKQVRKGEAVMVLGKLSFQTWTVTEKGEEFDEEFDMQKHFITAQRIIFMDRSKHRHAEEEHAEEERELAPV